MYRISGAEYLDIPDIEYLANNSTNTYVHVRSGNASLIPLGFMSAGVVMW